MSERSFTAIYSQTPRLLPEDEWNAALLAAVHPLDWVNPEPKDRYHLVVVGAGTAGLVSAAIAASLGAKVALVERHLMGGDCLNVGCVPSKALIAAARSWHEARTSASEFSGPRLAEEAGDFAAVMERLRRLRAQIAPIDGAARFRELGVDVFLGHGRFVASDSLEVGGKRLLLKKAVIATGGRAAAPNIPGLDNVPFHTNETIFSLTALPRRLAILGGGPIGCEMAQSFARFGSEVHLFQSGPRLLPRDDHEAAAVLAASLEREGVRVYLGAAVSRVELRDRGLALVDPLPAGGERTTEVDELLVAVGRKPNTEGLGLEAAGVDYGPAGVEVDDQLRTSNSRIFALGDVASRLKFTHHADAQARLMIRNAFFLGRGKSTELVVPWCTYTSPEVAQVGQTEEEARRQGVAFDVVKVELADVDRARLSGRTEGFLKVILAEGSDKILGATVVAEGAGDLIGQATLAMTQGIGLGAFGTTIYPYPTVGEVFRKAADAWNRRRLTPRAKSLLGAYFRLSG